MTESLPIRGDITRFFWGNFMNSWLKGLFLFASLCLFQSAIADTPVPVAAQSGKQLRRLAQVETVQLKPLDMAQLANEDLDDEAIGMAPRFALPVKVDVVPGRNGGWEPLSDGRVVWRYRIQSSDAASLNFAFVPFELPQSAVLWVYSPDLDERVGPFTADNNNLARQLWTPVLLANDAVIEVSVLASEKQDVDLNLTQIGHGYRFFGAKTAYCKSGSCNTDVACIADDSPWQGPRRAVASISEGGSRYCTGSLVNNTANDRKMIFATATHCTPDAPSLVAYWNFESPTCRTPGSAASGSGSIVGPTNQTSTGATFRAKTNNPFAGSGAANTRSDFTVVEFNQPANPAHNLYWAGWDRTNNAPQCCSPYSSTPCTPARYCASIHHPNTDEKRITFIREAMITGNISSATGVHWHVKWDLTPAVSMLPNLPLPAPSTLPASVTEPGSSGSPLYNDEQRFIGVLSGGASYCGAAASSMYDEYGKLNHAWEGLGTPATRAKDWLDPLGIGPETIAGIGTCDPPPVPTGLTAVANGDNRIDLSWNAVTGATGYRIYRGLGTCPGTGFVQIAESSATDYSDTTVSGGQSYVYRVSSYASADDCESAQGSCTSAVATGVCALPPSFAGLDTASSAGTASCGVNLAWNGATAHCGGPAVFNLYRSQTPGFTPSPASLIDSCLSASSLVDADVSNGVEYHYIVRAEDISGLGAGQCGGLEETNLIQRSATPVGPDQVFFTDDVESGTGTFSVGGSGAGADFSIVTSAAHSPTHAWFAPNANAISDRHLILPVDMSAAGVGTQLSFMHRYQTETNYDGAVLEYSLNGSQWFDILAGNGAAIPANASRFVEGGYVLTISTSFSSPIGGREAWSGDVGNAFVPVRVDLSDFVGTTFQLRWRMASDTSVGKPGWWIDDISLRVPQACGGAPIDPHIFSDGFEP